MSTHILTERKNLKTFWKERKLQNWFKQLLLVFLNCKKFKSRAIATFKNPKIYLLIAEAATRGVLEKKVFIEILQNSQENTCDRVSF